LLDIVCLQSQMLDFFNIGGVVRSLPSLRTSNKRYGRVAKVTCWQKGICFQGMGKIAVGTVNESVVLQYTRTETTLQCGLQWQNVSSPQNHTCV
jgi:hypothetical protein